MELLEFQGQLELPQVFVIRGALIYRARRGQPPGVLTWFLELVRIKEDHRQLIITSGSYFYFILFLKTYSPKTPINSL